MIFTARGFHIREPEFPLIAVVLPDQASFLRYCQKDKVPLKPGLRGYYLPSSNRVALFDATRNGLGDASDVDDTVIHEATHQVAFNLGIHSRMNADPKWVVEGLATVFEREAARLSNRQANVLSRVNPDRYAWFQRYRQSQRQPGALAKLVQSETFFDAAALDNYSEPGRYVLFAGAAGLGIRFLSAEAVAAGSVERLRFRKPPERFPGGVRSRPELVGNAVPAVLSGPRGDGAGGLSRLAAGLKAGDNFGRRSPWF